MPVPRTFGLCEDENIIGTSFFVMEFLDGNIYWDLLLEDFNPKIRRAIYDKIFLMMMKHLLFMGTTV